MNAFWEALLGVAAGGFITIAVSRWYYLKATRDLKKEAERFSQQSNAIMGALLNAKAERVPLYDSEGGLSGVAIGAAGNAAGSSSVDAEGKEKPAGL